MCRKNNILSLYKTNANMKIFSLHLRFNRKTLPNEQACLVGFGTN